MCDEPIRIIGLSHENHYDSTITNKEVLMMSLGANNARAPKFDIPIWHKLNLTIDEAAAYSNIGIQKRRIVPSYCGLVLAG